jgi:hypothetical protein
MPMNRSLLNPGMKALAEIRRRLNRVLGTDLRRSFHDARIGFSAFRSGGARSQPGDSLPRDGEWRQKPGQRVSRFWIVAVALLAFLHTWALPAGAFDEPDGFGKAKFGMNEVQLKALFPEAKEITPPPGEKAPAFGPKALLLENYSVGPLKNCRVELRLFQNQFYETQCACPDKEKVAEYLKKTYGTATTMSPTNLIWTGEKTGISYLVGNGAFAIDDLARSKSLSLSLLGMVLMKQATPEAAPAPAGGATPVAPQ